LSDHRGLEPVVEPGVVRDEKIVLLAGVKPPRREARELHFAAELDELLIASVISSSPRPDGWMSEMARRWKAEHVNAHQGEFDFGSFGFSMSRRQCPSAITSATPNADGFAPLSA